MRNKGVVSIVLVLFVVLAFSATTGMCTEEQAIHAVMMPGNGDLLETDDFTVPDGCEEIAYDDESAEAYWSYRVGGGQYYFAVHFTRPDDYETLETARFNII
ncbi:MAG: hypothetical protein EF813_03985 [Methanosarcinales archaeon]|nr:MAG: hypothetical protein EF813_03985 [Methanosarcinales archaeon]